MKGRVLKAALGVRSIIDYGVSVGVRAQVHGMYRAWGTGKTAQGIGCRAEDMNRAQWHMQCPPNPPAISLKTNLCSNAQTQKGQGGRLALA